MFSKYKPVAPEPEHIKWCTALNNNVFKSKLEIKVSNYINQDSSSDPNYWNKFIAEIDKKSTKSGEEFVIAVIDGVAGEHYWSNAINGEKLTSVHLDGLSITHAVHGILTISKYKIYDLVISQPIDELFITQSLIKRIIIKDNCKIGKLSLHSCTVGNLKIGINAIQDLEIDKGAILGIHVPNPANDNPFSGSVTINNNVYFPSTARDSMVLNTHSYRYFHYHLVALQNFETAKRFHGLEMILERDTDTLFNKWLSYGYEWICNFGNSTIRPVGWLFGLWLVFAALYWWVEMAVPSMQITLYTGWRSILIEYGTVSDLARAAMLSLEEMINPLGLFSSKTLVSPAQGWGAIVGSLHSLFSTISLTLFVLAIRRRFKIGA